MADVEKRLAGPTQLGTVAATVYTVPAATTAIIRHVRVTNTTTASAHFTMSIGADGAATRWFHQALVRRSDKNMPLNWSGSLVLAAGEIVQAYSDTATALTLVISGIESS